MASPLPFHDALEKRMGGLRSKSGFRVKPWPIFILGLSILMFATVLMWSSVSLALQMAFFLAPVWLPPLILGGAWRLWVDLRRSEFIARQEHILLEIKPPRSIEKTPLAMEAVLSGLHHSPGEGTWYKRFIDGSVRPWWSLEIVSLGGEVHFFIWTRRGYRRQIESQVYAQYPGAQVTEVPDYTRMLSAAPEEWSIWGCEFLKTNPVDAVPIKTYIEYGLDKTQKEPEQIDPLANLVEFMGSMKKGEYLWLQLVIRVHKGEKYNKLKDGKTYTWQHQAQEFITEVRKKTREPYIDPATGEERPGFPNPTKGQMELIAAVERNISKLSFDTGIRGIYISTPEAFDGIAIGGLTGIFKQFHSEGWSGFRPNGGMTQFDDYPWEVGISTLKTIIRRGLIDAYRRRQFFHEPHVCDYTVMSTEELATLFHVPSRAVEAPALERIPSSTGEAPPNLPV
jgi:hypothetical protein